MDNQESISIDKVDFVNEEGINNATIEEAFEKTETPVPVQMFMQEDEQVEVEVDIFSEKKTGKILAVFKKDAFKPDGEDFGFAVHKFSFSIPTFEEVSEYRQRSSNNSSRLVDKNMFRNFLMAMHLKDWTLTDNAGQKIELEFEADGTLSKKSIRIVNKVPTVVWDVVLTNFEKETLIN
jgi:hypothetical protein